MHRYRPTHHGTQPKAFLMTRLDKPGFTGIVVSILALNLYRGLLQGKLQYSTIGAARCSHRSSKLGAENPRGDRHWRKQR